MITKNQTVTAALTFEVISCNWYVCLLLGRSVKGWVGELRGLTDWLTGYLVDIRTGWLTEQLAGLLADDWSVNLVDQFVSNQSIDWWWIRHDWLVDYLNDKNFLIINWVIYRSIYWLIDFQICKLDNRHTGCSDCVIYFFRVLVDLISSLSQIMQKVIHFISFFF